MRKLTFLGTGHAMPKHSATTAILLEEDGKKLLMDCAGGHEIIGRIDAAGVKVKEFTDIFISHSDSDHILGIVPLMRVVKHMEHKLNIYCNKPTYEAVSSLFTVVSRKHWELAQEKINWIEISDNTDLKLHDWKLSFFETGTKVPMHGIQITFGDGFRMFYPGDEPVSAEVAEKIHGVDLLLHEAFCLDKDEPEYEAHKKAHSTAKDAAQIAAALEAKHLALIHMEDDSLTSRKENYKQEVTAVFSGKVTVPVDLDILEF